MEYAIAFAERSQLLDVFLGQEPIVALHTRLKLRELEELIYGRPLTLYVFVALLGAIYQSSLAQICVGHGSGLQVNAIGPTLSPSSIPGLHCVSPLTSGWKR